MRIYAHHTLQTLVEGAGDNSTVTSLTFRRSDASPLTVQFVDRAGIFDLGAPQLAFVLKTEDKYDQDPPLLLNGVFTKTGTGSSAEWKADLNFITTLFDAAFAVDGDDTNDLEEITVMGELVWIINGETRSSGRLSVTITNNVYRGTETPVEETAAPGTYLTPAAAAALYPQVDLSITTLTQLRAHVTNGRQRPYLLAVSIPGKAKLWEVKDGTAADNGDWQLRPDDYADTTNEVNIESYL